MGLINIIHFSDYKNYNSEDRINLKEIYPPKDEINTNVYLIILDGMISLDKAYKNDIIDSKTALLINLVKMTLNTMRSLIQIILSHMHQFNR